MNDLRTIRAQLRAIYHSAVLAGNDESAIEIGQLMVAIDLLILD